MVFSFSFLSLTFTAFSSVGFPELSGEGFDRDILFRAVCSNRLHFIKCHLNYTYYYINKLNILTKIYGYAYIAPHT